MKSFAVSVLIILCAQGAALAADTPKAANESGRPGEIINHDDCAKLWNNAAGRSDLTAEQAKPFVMNFEQVDANHDKKISNSEFQDGCKMGFVQREDKSSSTGSSSGQ